MNIPTNIQSNTTFDPNVNLKKKGVKKSKTNSTTNQNSDEFKKLIILTK